MNSRGRESQLTQLSEKVVRHGGGEGREGENLASLYQNVMENKQRELEVAEKDDPTRSKNSVCAGDRGQEREGEGVSSKSAASRESDMIIHVFDEQRKCNQKVHKISQQIYFFSLVLCRSKEGVLLSKRGSSERDEILLRVPLIRHPTLGRGGH